MKCVISWSFTINHKPGHSKSDVNQIYSTGGKKVINSMPAIHSRVVLTNYLVNRGDTILHCIINCTNKLIKASRAVNAMLTNQNTCTDNGDSRVMIFTCGLKMFT